MSLNNLTTETMVILSDILLHPKKRRGYLTALPLLVPLIPVLQAAHDNLLAKQKTTSALEAELADLQEEQARRDKRHDRKIRGSHTVLTGFAEQTDNPELARRVLDLRDRLLPNGISAVTRSYVDEAGDAQRLPSRLDPASRELLAALPTADGPLADHVNAWLEEAAQIGALEERRLQIKEQLASGDRPTAAEVVAARNAWIRAVRAIETNLALDPTIDPEIVEKILGPIRRAETKAERRRAAAKSTAVKSTADDETIDATPEPAVDVEPSDAQAEPGAPAQDGGKAP